MSLKDKNILNFSFDEKSERIIELENNPEFKKLTYNQQIILLTGEKLLQIDQKIRTQASLINEFISEYGNALTDIASNQKNISSFIRDLVKKETLNLVRDIQNSNGISTFDEQKVIDLIEEKYNEEISNMESRFEHATQQTIKNFDESIFDTMERLDSLTQFQIKAKEEIQKSQDRIYLLEEEIARQKEINETLEKSFKERIDSLSNSYILSDENSPINKYKYYDSRFDTIEQLEEFIREESKKIAKDEVEKYIHDYNLFSEDRSDELIEKLFEEGQLKESEISKVYKLQIDNNSKMSDLEYLLDEQNRQIKLLSEDRQNLVLTLSELLKNKNVDVSKILETIPFKNFDNEFIYKEKADIDNVFDVNAANILNKQEMEILVKKQAIELVKDKIKFLNNKKNDMKALNSIKELNEDSKELENYFNEANKKIKLLEEELKKQIIENDNLKNDLFDEISKNNIESKLDDSINDFNDNINKEIDFDMMSEEDFMKHNYYNGSTPIPGTKITRINNYKINSDVNSSNFNNDAQDLIKQDIEKNIQNETNTKKLWNENSQKLIDLENLITRQEEEIKRLKDTKSNHINSNQYDYKKSKNNDTLNSIDESIKSALNKLQDLTFAQEKTKKEIEETNKRIIELESQIKRSKNNEYEDELARKELDKIIEEKYKFNNYQQDLNYSEEIRKIELERRKIEETLELERIRLLSEIEANRKMLNNAPVEEKKHEPVIVQVQPVITKEPEAPIIAPVPQHQVVEQPKEQQPKVILETPKRKRKQQFFYEIKVHSTPKLTRADIEK